LDFIGVRLLSDAIVVTLPLNFRGAKRFFEVKVNDSPDISSFDLPSLLTCPSAAPIAISKESSVCVGTRQVFTDLFWIEINAGLVLGWLEPLIGNNARWGRSACSKPRTATRLF
jgi:hypothetical protein